MIRVPEPTLHLPRVLSIYGCTGETGDPHYILVARPGRHVVFRPACCYPQDVADAITRLSGDPTCWTSVRHLESWWATGIGLMVVTANDRAVLLDIYKSERAAREAPILDPVVRVRVPAT